jgi:hypothetical protein
MRPADGEKGMDLRKLIVLPRRTTDTEMPAARRQIP